MFLMGDISIFSPSRFSEIVALLTAPAVQYVKETSMALLEDDQVNFMLKWKERETSPLEMDRRGRGNLFLQKVDHKIFNHLFQFTLNRGAI
jgi:hypothetical protein